MAIQRSVLMVELLLSADRVITAAQQAPPALPDPRARADADGRWPAATVVGHLSMVDQEVWLPRLDAMVAGRAAGSPPAFTWWEPDAARTAAQFAGLDPDAAGAQLLASRTALLHRLRELSDDDWSAAAEHDIFGTLDVAGLLLQVLAHDEEHRAAILLVEPEV